MALAIIAASAGSAPAWLATMQGRAVGGNVFDPLDLDPEPVVVEEVVEGAVDDALDSSERPQSLTWRSGSRPGRCSRSVGVGALMGVAHGTVPPQRAGRAIPRLSTMATDSGRTARSSGPFARMLLGTRLDVVRLGLALEGAAALTAVGSTGMGSASVGALVDVAGGGGPGGLVAAWAARYANTA